MIASLAFIERAGRPLATMKLAVVPSRINLMTPSGIETVYPKIFRDGQCTAEHRARGGCKADIASPSALDAINHHEFMRNDF